MLSIDLVGYVLKAAFRDKLLLFTAFLIAFSAGMSAFMASSAIFENGQFLTVYASGSLRILGVFALILFCVFFIRRSFETKDVEFLLSRPISRVTFIVSYACAFSVLAIIVASFCSLGVLITTHVSSYDALLVWSGSLVAEYIIMVNVALFFSLVLSSSTISVMVTFAFYALARMMGEILGILDSGISNSLIEGLQVVMNFISSLTPRLDLFAQTTWLVYGVDENIDVSFIVVQGGLSVLLVLLLALIDLHRREF